MWYVYPQDVILIFLLFRVCKRWSVKMWRCYPDFILWFHLNNRNFSLTSQIWQYLRFTRLYFKWITIYQFLQSFWEFKDGLPLSIDFLIWYEISHIPTLLFVPFHRLLPIQWVSVMNMIKLNGSNLCWFFTIFVKL